MFNVSRAVLIFEVVLIDSLRAVTEDHGSHVSISARFIDEVSAGISTESMRTTDDSFLSLYAKRLTHLSVIFINSMNAHTCRNVYFSSEFYIDGKKKDVRIVKKLLAQVEKDLLNNVEVNDYEK